MIPTQDRLIETAKHTAMILICLMSLFPILWILTQALMSYFDTIAVPPKIFFKPVLDNFREVLMKPGFLSSLKGQPHHGPKPSVSA
jgi:ABC-type glycerol-3-phosphate transport system permease component